jgi:hypothetical protein
VNLSQNLAWTAESGDAYANQRQELTGTIRTVRHLAKAITAFSADDILSE